MTVLDIVILIVYFIIIYLIAFVYSGQKRDDLLYRKYFLKGLTVKLIGGLGFALVYTYYYEYGGDTKAYFRHAEVIYEYFFHDFSKAFEYVFSSNIDLSKHSFVDTRAIFQKGTKEFFTVGMVSILNLFCLNNYFALTLVFASLSFIGIWKLFYLIAKKYQYLESKIAFAVLFVPSVFFWGSGIMKDTIVIGFTGLLLFHFYKIVEHRKILSTSTIFTLFSAYIIYNVKEYVIVSLAPALMIWWVFEIRNSIKNKLLKVLILPFTIAVLLVGVIYTFQFLSDTNSKFSLDNVLNTAQGMQSWHQVQSHRINGDLGRGSSYSLGEYDQSLLGIVKMVPTSINVTLFRPYPTEVKSAAMAVASVESLIILCASIYILFATGIRRIFSFVNNDSFLLMSLVFSLFFAFAVGFTSYNFGALVRYKIPCIPFYLSALFILHDKSKRIKRRKMRL